MPRELNNFTINNLGVYGVIREAEVSSRLLPSEAVTEAINMHFDSKGASTVRPGLTSIQSTAVVSGYPCLGVYMFNFSAGSALLSTFSDGTNNDIYSLSNGYWSKTHQDDTAGSKTRFITFSDYVLKMNGNDTMFMWAGPGTTWIGSGNPLNIDDMTTRKPKFGEVFKARVYVAGDPTNPDRLFYSSVVDSLGNIEWTPASDYVDINPDDGENISGLKRFGTQLCVFKPNYMYRYMGIAGTDADPLISVGTRSQESIVSAKDGLYFHHDSGFYKYAGGQPSEISRPISDFVSAIPVSYYSNIAGWKDNDHVYWSIGDLTVNGTTYVNIVLRYTISSQVWTIYSYPKEIKCGVDYNDGDTIHQVVGTDDGFIAKQNEGSTDMGTSIAYRLQTKWYEIEGIENTKVIETIASTCDKATGSMVMYQIDDDPAWKEIGQIRKYMNIHPNLNIKFHKIRFKITGSSSKEAPIFYGLNIIKGLNYGLVI